jgi:dTDP-4-dehydrorhamnose 3,5-epimerase
MIEGVIVTPQKIIAAPGGDVLRGVKNSDSGYVGFGEAYFSTIEYAAVKGWKRHNEMTLNILVPIGEIRFVMFDERTDSSTHNNIYEITISRSSYCRLTVPPKIWMAFQGVAKKESLLLNIADIPHDPEEADSKKISDIEFDWRIIV